MQEGACRQRNQGGGGCIRDVPTVWGHRYVCVVYKTVVVIRIAML